MDKFQLADAISVLENAKIRGESTREMQLKVKVLPMPGMVGGSACVDVTGMYLGFDWDDGKVIIHTDKPLTALSPEDIAAIHKSAKEGQSWHVYQQYKRHAEEISRLKQEVADGKRVIAEMQGK